LPEQELPTIGVEEVNFLNELITQMPEHMDDAGQLKDDLVAIDALRFNSRVSLLWCDRLIIAMYRCSGAIA
jgi:hypothetical protein